MTDIVFTVVPKRTTSLYYASQMPESLARLKGSVQAFGFSAKSLDLNIDYYRAAILSRQLKDLDEFFDGFNFYWNEKDLPENKDLVEWIDQMVQVWFDNIMDNDPTWVGLSVFTNYSLTACYLLAKKLREDAPQVKIVIGGFSVDTFVGFYKETMNTIIAENDGTLLDVEDRIGDFFLNAGLADYFITGEGEFAIVELLKGNDTYPGINDYKPLQIQDVNTIPKPDWSDHEMHKYIMPDPSSGRPIPAMLPISSSRGCVNKCAFCNIPTIFPKFKLFSPDFIYHQVVDNYEDYGITEFRFTDSVINGSPTRIEDWLKKLIEYQQDNNVQFGFEGSVIVLDDRRWPVEKFEMLKSAGFRLLAFGMESGSEKVRYEMNKKHPQQWVDAFVRRCLDSGIRLSISIIIGYPTETEKDFEDTLDMFRRYTPEIRSRQITFELSTFSTTDCDMPLLRKNNIELRSVNNSVGGWVADAPCDSFYTALLRTKKADALLDELGYYNNNTSKMKFYDDMLDDPRYKDYYQNWRENPDLEFLPEGM